MDGRRASAATVDARNCDPAQGWSIRYPVGASCRRRLRGKSKEIPGLQPLLWSFASWQGRITRPQSPASLSIYRSMLDPKINRHFEVFDPVDFLPVLSQRIPDKEVRVTQSAKSPLWNCTAPRQTRCPSSQKPLTGKAVTSQNPSHALQNARRHGGLFCGSRSIRSLGTHPRTLRDKTEMGPFGLGNPKRH